MIACVQMQLDAQDYYSAESFRHKVFSLMDKARQVSKSQQLLVVFPEHIGTFCLLCNEGKDIWTSLSFSEAVRKIIRAHFIPVTYNKLFKSLSWVRSLVLAKYKQAQEIYFSTFQEAARTYDAWIVAGSTLLASPNKRDVYNTSVVFDNEGQVISQQNKVHLVELEGSQGLDVSPGKIGHLQVIDSPFGRLGIAICLDAFRENVWHQLHELGAEILIQPSANNGPWNDWQKEDWATGSYRAVYEKQMFRFAINPMLVGGLWDLEFFGQSSIISQSGYVKLAVTADSEELIISDVL